jgi:hypothetical protein
MSSAELVLFKSLARCSDEYLEFGAGGSTCVAASLVGAAVTAIDSSQLWLDRVAQHCSATGARITPSLVHVDVGPTGDLGVPTDPGTRDMWPAYHGAIWTNAAAADADLFLIDGRFRVACFMQTVLHCKAGALILFHDFASRRQYHAVLEVAREVARTEDLSVFQSGNGGIRKRAQELLDRHRFDFA